MFPKCETDFNLDKHIITFLSDNVFFAELSRHIRKCSTEAIPTAAIAFDLKADEFTLFWNPKFFASLTTPQIKGVLTHEFYHFIFDHVCSRRRDPPRLWNVATDLAINSLIVENEATSGKDKHCQPGEADCPLPRFCLFPGMWPVHPDGRELSTEEKEGSKLSAVIAGLPKMKASEWYYTKIKQECPNAGKGFKVKMKLKGGKGQGDPGDDGSSGDQDSDQEVDVWIDSMDDHSSWDDLTEEQREYIEQRVKAIVEKSANVADQQSNGWGNIPSELREEIRASFSRIVNWRAVLRQFIGSINRGNRTTSIKRINKRYPYVHPGAKRGYTAKLLIAIDQSGSVSDDMLADFFGELGSLTKKTTIDILPFDCSASEKDIFTWRRGTTPAVKRVKAGGTDFNAPTNLVNDPKNRGRWDGCLILTDGECDKPGPSRIKRGWVLGKGHKLLFDISEMQIFLDNSKQFTGAWR